MSSWFVAFPIEPGEWFACVPSPPVGTKRLAAADLHLTVAFLGDVGADRARAGFEALGPARGSRFAIRLGGVMPMGARRRPSALSARVEAWDGDTLSLAERLTPMRDAVLLAARVAPDSRAMKPHVTLARLRRKARAEETKRALAWARGCDFDSGRIVIDRVGLYTKARAGAPRAYDIVESLELGVDPIG